jgi:hypothetical protein
MARRSIMNEGEAQTDSSTPDADETTNTDSERIQTTLRIPTDLADDLDEWADTRGMSRNAAITYFIAEGLPSE